MELELKQVMRYARQWWWLLLALPVIAGLAAYVVANRQSPVYSATATLFVEPAQNNGDGTDFSYLQSGQRLATTYQQVVESEPILLPVAERLGAPYTVGVLAEKVSSSAVNDTQLLRISVTDTSPQQAATIANLIASQIQEFISSKELAGASTSRVRLEGLVENTQHQVNEVQDAIIGLEAEPNLTTAQNAELDALRSRLSQLQQSLADLIIQQQNFDLNSSALQNQVQVFIPASIPSAPFAPNVSFYTALGFILGATMAIVTIALLEYLDNTVKPGTNFTQIVGAPLLSVIRFLPKLSAGRSQLFVLEQPTTSSAESVRLLRTNVEFAAASQEISALAVSSAGPGEGKSTVTANLAATMAQAGFSVVVVDADLRRPTQHNIFGVSNERGVTTLLTRPDRAWRSVAVQVVPNLLCIPAGPTPPNPSDLLSSERFRDLIAQIKSAVDIVIIDTPPVLAVSDPLIVATATDGVLLVSRAGHTRIEALERAAASFPETVRRVGVVLNQQTRSRGEAEYYYGAYYGLDDHKPPKVGLGAAATRFLSPKKMPLESRPAGRLEG